MSSDKKRPRACDTCHSIKIKCELGSTAGGEPPCARCLRLGKDCVVSPPKRQKDRVAELEAQVEALTKLLQEQNIHPETASTSASISPLGSSDEIPETNATSRAGTNGAATITGHKKRRLDDDFTPPASDHESYVFEHNRQVELDFVLPHHVQQELLSRYLHDLVPYFPVVPIAGDQSYESLRRERPLLLQAAIYCATFGALSLDKQEDVGKIVMDLFAAKAMEEGEKSAELIQAIQAAVLYYRTTKHHTHIAAWQFIQLAGGLAEDIGIGGPQRPPALNCPNGGPYVDSSEAWRTWLVCHMLSATLALFMRKPNSSSWDERDEGNLQMLEYSYFRMETDELLCQHVRAERLCDIIATQQCLYDNAPTVDVADPTVQLGMQRLQDSMTDWRSQIPASVKGPVMDFWQHIATLYLHEPVLHTPTNNPSFAAPFIAPRISVTDFPCPLPPTPSHLTSIHTLTTSIHSTIDLFAALSTAHLTALPAMYFPGRVAYAIYLLAKLYVALTAPGNTLGAYVDPGSLRMEEYLEKNVRNYNRVAAIDEWCGQARILSSAFRMREWYVNYRANFLADGKAVGGNGGGGGGQVPAAVQQPTYDLTSGAAGLPDDWSNNLAFMDGMADYGLEAFFADPLLTDWFPQPFDEGTAVAAGTTNEMDMGVGTGCV